VSVVVGIFPAAREIEAYEGRVLARSEKNMLRKLMPFLMAVLILLSYQGGCKPKSRPIPVSPDRIEVFFSPHGGCTEAVVEALGKTRTSVLIQAYSFTSAPIAKAIVEAHGRGGPHRGDLG
jgi:hypothetical protein